MKGMNVELVKVDEERSIIIEICQVKIKRNVLVDRLVNTKKRKSLRRLECIMYRESR